MSKHKILYVCQELYPYVPETQMSTRCREMLQALQDKGNDIRTFLPRYGNINERRNQLHEVIRLSGMNLIIDNDDHQLIIKVASIPSARLQVYFIDNDDYFHRKAQLADEEGNSFEDNDERAIFFARGVLETVKKLGWQPGIVHCQGWFSSFAAIYLRTTFADDPLFRDSKIVVSIYNDRFEGMLNGELKRKLENEGINDKKTDILTEPSYENLMRLVIDYADGVVIEEDGVADSILEYASRSGKAMLKRKSNESEEQLVDEYQELYDEIFS